MNGPQPGAKNGGENRLLLFILLLAAVLAMLFHRSFLPTEVLFANDGTLGSTQAESGKYPDIFTGRWLDNNWLGAETLSASPSISGFSSAILSPVMYFKVYAPFTMLLLGFSAWLFFRQLRFHPMVCLLGGLAAGLNTHAFSTACWGLTPWNIALATTFLAFAAITSPSIKQGWAKGILAGLAIGVTVMEGFDVGAILSIYAGIFVFFLSWISGGGFGTRCVRSVFLVALVAGFAGFTALHTISGLVGTQIKGIVGTQQDDKTKEARWNFSTQWSLPKREALRVIIPGMFGYRMQEHISDADKSSSYWGTIAADPVLDLFNDDDPMVHVQAAQSLGLQPEFTNALASSDRRVHDQALQVIKANLPVYRRHSGSGEHAGVLVALMAFFAIANSFRKGGNAFAATERKAVWFWAIAAAVSLLLSFGRHGFLYQFIYQLPYFSTIRNPIKFLHPFHVAWLILAAYGLEALCRQYLQPTVSRTQSLSAHVKTWWARAAGFEKKWSLGMILVVVGCFVGFLLFGSSKTELIKYLETETFAPALAPQIASFAIKEVFLFLVFLVASVAAIICILSGAWAGTRAKWAWIFLGLILVVDLARADAPWIRYFDYKYRYASNSAIEFLREKPYEHRVTAEKAPLSRAPLTDDQNFFVLYYDWLQNHFLAENIQSLDIIQMPRKPAFDEAYMDAFRILPTPSDPNADLSPAVRLWKLTNTRYMIGSKNMLDRLNAADPEKSLRICMPLEMLQKPGVSRLSGVEDLTVEKNENGRFAIFELGGALPRAKLYAHWETQTNNAATLNTLVSPTFDMKKTVLLASETPVANKPGDADSDPGTVSIVDYHPKYVKLQANAKSPAVLLLNDRTAPSWKAWIDGKPAPVLRCNYIMRGVFVPEPGEHTIEFRFQPPLKTFYASLAAWGVGLMLAGFLLVSNRNKNAQPDVLSAKTQNSKAPSVN